MHRFIKADGTEVQSETFMRGPALGDGHHWAEENEAWVEKPFPIGTVDPNCRTLFGYDEQEFLARQYKRPAMQIDLLIALAGAGAAIYAARFADWSRPDES